jgi:hypothetical protein
VQELLSRRRAGIEQSSNASGKGYDQPQTIFNNDGDIANVRRSMLKGAVRSGALWDLLHPRLPIPAHPPQHRLWPAEFSLAVSRPGGGSNDATGGG